jgi:hypothetical protein
MYGKFRGQRINRARWEEEVMSFAELLFDEWKVEVTKFISEQTFHVER